MDLFAPKNDVLLAYLNSVILENYKSLDQLPLQILVDFLNAHMWQHTVWPSKFATTNNVQSEPARFDPAADIIDKKLPEQRYFLRHEQGAASQCFQHRLRPPISRPEVFADDPVAG